MTGSGGLPKNLPPDLLCLNCVASSTFVNEVWRVDGLSNSQIWKFLAIAPSSLVQRSLIWEGWALIFFYHLHWDLEIGSSSSDPALMAETETDLLDTDLFECWWVPRTLANSFLNCIKDTCSISNSNVLAIDMLLQSYNWLAYCCFSIVSKLMQKLGFLLMTFLAKSWSSSANNSSNSLECCAQL